MPIQASTIDYDLAFYIKRDRTNQRWSGRLIRSVSAAGDVPQDVADLESHYDLFDWMQEIVEEQFGDGS